MWKSILAFLGGANGPRPAGELKKARYSPLDSPRGGGETLCGAAIRLVQEHGRGKAFDGIAAGIDKNWQNRDAEIHRFVDCIQFHKLRFVKNRVGQIIQNRLTDWRVYSIL